MTEVKVCEVVEDGVKCEQRHWGNGYCRKHNARYLRHGDPLFYTHERVEQPSYYGAHNRVKSRRGSASQYMCACGAQARDWAYDHADPDELTAVIRHRTGSVSTAPYSASIDHYIPMCRPCHLAFDRQ